MMKRIAVLYLCLCLLIPAFVSAESVEEALVAGMVSNHTTELRPLLPKERSMVSVYGAVYESLVTIDDNGIPQPLLAEKWSESGGGSTWIFTLREDVHFSDGTPLTAHDIVASWDYIHLIAQSENVMDNGFYRNLIYQVSSMKATDTNTIQVKASRDYYGLLYAMTFPVVPASQVDTPNPVGSGPYVFSSFEPFNYVALKRNESWWRATPQVEDIMIMLYPSNKEMITAYEYGRIDTAFTRSVSAAQYKSGISSLSIPFATRQLETLLMNHTSFPLNNLNIRRAIRYAINKARIADTVYMGMNIDADTPIPANSWLYYDQESAYVYNVDYAKNLLAEEGWADTDNDNILDKVVDGAQKNFYLRLCVYEDPENDIRFETADLIVEMLEELQIKVTIDARTYDQTLTSLKAGSFDLALCAFEMDVVPDVAFFLKGGAPENYCRYKSSEMDKLINTLRSNHDQMDYAYTTRAIQQQFEKDVPFICLFYRTGSILTRKMFTSVRSLREYELLRGIESFGN